MVKNTSRFKFVHSKKCSLVLVLNSELFWSSLVEGRYAMNITVCIRVHCLLKGLNIYVYLLDQVTTVNQRMLEWLTNVSLHSAPNPYQRKIFASKPKLQAITELDGSTCHSFYTVLNIAHYCFPDQWLNIYTFSILKQWLHNTWRFQEGVGEISINIPRGQDSITSDSPSATVQSSFSEPTFLDERMLRTPGADEMYEEISDKHSASPLHSNSPSFSEITQAFSDNSSTPVKYMDDTMSVESYGNLSSMRQVFGSESSFFSESRQDGSLARKAMAYCHRLLRQSECSKFVILYKTLLLYSMCLTVFTYFCCIF